MSFFTDASQSAINKAIEQVKISGPGAVSKEQLRLVEDAAKQAGVVGQQARIALGRK